MLPVPEGLKPVEGAKCPYCKLTLRGGVECKICWAVYGELPNGMGYIRVPQVTPGGWAWGQYFRDLGREKILEKFAEFDAAERGGEDLEREVFAPRRELRQARIELLNLIAGRH